MMFLLILVSNWACLWLARLQSILGWHNINHEGKWSNTNFEMSGMRRSMNALVSMENRPATISSGVPAFLAKLWKLVEDPQSNHLISWSPDETSFIVHDQVTFSRDILPKYFKHNNFASFVRQLNMYGFRKVVGADQGGLKAEKDDWQFQNSNFLRRQPHLLENVKRKSAPDDKKPKGEEYTRVLTDIHQLKGKQEDMSSKLDQVRRENQSLYQELMELRQKHEEQEHVVNKLIRFLMKLLYSNNGLGGNKRPLMLQGPDSCNSKRQCTQPINLDNPGPSQTQQDSYNIRSPPRPPNIPVMQNNYSETSGPEITAVDDDEFPSISISAVRPIINEPGNTTSTPEDSYPSLRHYDNTAPQPSHYADSYQTISPQSRIMSTMRNYPAVSTTGIGMVPNRNTAPIVTSAGTHVDREQLQHHVKYIEENLDSFQNILASGSYGDSGMLDDFLDSIVDGGDSPPPNHGDGAREVYSSSTQRSELSPTQSAPSTQGPPPRYTQAQQQTQQQMGKHINWSVTSMLPDQDRSSRRY